VRKLLGSMLAALLALALGASYSAARLGGGTAKASVQELGFPM
jgi:hypothetical protein